MLRDAAAEAESELTVSSWIALSPRVWICPPSINFYADLPAEWLNGPDTNYACDVSFFAC